MTRLEVGVGRERERGKGKWLACLAYQMDPQVECQVGIPGDEAEEISRCQVSRGLEDCVMEPDFAA